MLKSVAIERNDKWDASLTLLEAILYSVMKANRKA